MCVHITKTMQVCFFQLQRLRRVRHLLSHDVTANLVATLVFKWLDYCNALLAGLPHSSVAWYECIINAAVRLVNGLQSHNHVTQSTIELHWLPAEARLQYKLCLLIHHAVTGAARAYIIDHHGIDSAEQIKLNSHLVWFVWPSAKLVPAVHAVL